MYDDIDTDGNPQATIATIVVVMTADGRIGWQCQGEAQKVVTALGMLAQAAQGIALPPHEHTPPVPKLEVVRSMPSADNGF